MTTPSATSTLAAELCAVVGAALDAVEHGASVSAAALTGRGRLFCGSGTDEIERRTRRMLGR